MLWGTDRNYAEQPWTHSTQRKRNMIPPLFEQLSLSQKEKIASYLTLILLVWTSALVLVHI